MLVDASQLNALAIDLGAAGVRVANEAAKLTQQTALDIEGTAKGFAPVRTGNLRRSIHHEMRQGGLEAEIGTDVEYAAFVEFGTSRMAPQAYMGPAFDRHVPEYLEGLSRITGESVLSG